MIGGGEWIGADAESIAEAGGGYPADAMGGEEEGNVWEEWDSGDWVEGTGIDSRTWAEAKEAVAAAEAVAGAGARTEEVEAVVEVEAVDATAGDVAGAEPEVAAAEAVVSAEAEAGAEVVQRQ